MYFRATFDGPRSAASTFDVVRAHLDETSNSFESDVYRFGRCVLYTVNTYRRRADPAVCQMLTTGGGQVVSEDAFGPLFALTITEELAAIWEMVQRDFKPHLWDRVLHADPMPAFNDGYTIGLMSLSHPMWLLRLTELITETGGAVQRIEVDPVGGVRRFQAVATARCLGCDNDAMRFIDRAVHELGDDQLACVRCDAMFALGDYLTSAEPDN